jgi:hypothetical protein
MGRIGNRFVRDVKAFAAAEGIPILRLKKPDRTRWDDRKLDHVRPYLERAEREGRFGVVAIVAAQEFQWVFGGRDCSDTPGLVQVKFEKAERRVGVYYFYLLDREFGPGFVKICTYFPYPAKVWLNGHERPSGRPSAQVSRSLRSATASRAAANRSACKRSVTVSALGTCRRSSTVG